MNNNYVAWFYQSYLLGVWTLNSSTGLFLHPRTGPNGFTDWSHNELLRGSASPNQQVWQWDTGSPGIEYTLVFGSPAGPNYLLTHHAGYFAANGQYQVIADGALNAFGLDGYVYGTTTRMAGSVAGAPLVVDVSDGNDGNGIQNYVQSDLAYVCRDNDIKVVWRFKPSAAPVTVWRTYYHMWAHYSIDTDFQWCGVQSDSHPTLTYGEPQYYRSSLPTHVNNVPAVANVTHPLVRGTACDSNVNYVYAVGNPAAGSWFTWGENSSLASGTPKWTWTHEANTVFGTPLALSYFGAGNETADGVWGGGGVRDDLALSNPYSPSVWNTVSFRFSTK